MQNKLTLIAIILFGLISVACSPNPTQPVEPTPDYSLYSVHPVLREFYSVLGGESTLGPVISEPTENLGVIRQYVLNAELVYDPFTQATKWFQLGSIGNKLKIAENPDPNLTVAEPFLEIYKKLGGEVFVGKPLTGMEYNEEMARFEQYFENLGFYLGEDTSGIVRLLPYGVWICDQACRDLSIKNAIPEIPTPNLVINTPTPKPTNTPTPQIWTLQVWETLPLISSSQEQEISVAMWQNNQPLAGVTPEILITLPDGTVTRFKFPASGSDGITRLVIQPIQAANDTIIPYQVCMDTAPHQRYCMAQNYVIFGNP